MPFIPSLEGYASFQLVLITEESMVDPGKRERPGISERKGQSMPSESKGLKQTVTGEMS